MIIVSPAAMPETRSSKKLKNPKEAARKRLERKKQKETLSDERKAELRKANRIRQQKYRASLSKAKQKKIYEQQYKYKQAVWLKKPINAAKHSDYCRESRIKRQNYNSFEAGFEPIEG